VKIVSLFVESFKSSKHHQHTVSLHPRNCWRF